MSLQLIPVMINGHPAHMDELMAIAKEHNLVVIEDCAQCYLAYRLRGIQRWHVINIHQVIPYSWSTHLDDADMSSMHQVTPMIGSTARVIHETRMHSFPRSRYYKGQIVGSFGEYTPVGMVMVDHRPSCDVV